MKISKWLKSNTESLVGKTVAISGATGGIGRELCRYFAALGASLVLLDRNAERSGALSRELCEAYPSLSVTNIRVDMTDMATVRSAAESLSDMPLDFLVLNAGAYSIPRCICDTGYDNVFQINFVSPYYLARKLLPQLEARGGRVVAVGSIAHNYSKTDREDIDFRTRSKASLVYGNAKRYLMYALGALGGSGAVAITHPGITFTNITAHYPKLIFAIIKHPMKIIFMHPRRASLSILRGLFEATGEREWIGPRLFDVWGLPRKKKLRTCSEEEAEFICRAAEEIYQKLDV